LMGFTAAMPVTLLFLLVSRKRSDEGPLALMF